MRVAVAVLCVVVAAGLLSDEFFVVLPRTAEDTMLGVFGALGLLAILGMLSIGVIGCYAGLLWSAGARFSATTAAPFGQDLYFSAAAFVSAFTPSEPSHSLGKVLQVVEAANGLRFLAIAIGYLPALFQAFSRREVAVSRLDPRAGSPPTAARCSSIHHGAVAGGSSTST